MDVVKIVFSQLKAVCSENKNTFRNARLSNRIPAPVKSPGVPKGMMQSTPVRAGRKTTEGRNTLAEVSLTMGTETLHLGGYQRV